jgi:DNA-binding transcriptional regulator LsrR (DeoR family)
MRRKTTLLDKQTAAYMYAVQRRSQDYIAGVLGISQSVVSRLLKEAESDGFIETSVRFLTRKVTAERMREIEVRASPRGVHLAQRLEAGARGSTHSTGINVRILPSASYATSPAAWAHRIEQFAAASHDHVRSLLMESNAVGVAWGATVAAVVHEFSSSTALRVDAPIQFVPLMGEPLGTATSRFSSSRLAVDLDQTFNRGSEHCLSLALVPALIPQSFLPVEVKAIRRLIAHVRSYQDIFEGRENGGAPWVSCLDAIITSVSTSERPLGFDHDNLVKTARMSRTDLEVAVVGDLCGALIPRKGHENEVRSMSEYWTGITLDQIRACAVRSSGQGKPGVILLAIGRNKSRVVFAVAQMGLVNQVIIDQDLADGLEEICAGSA